MDPNIIGRSVHGYSSPEISEAYQPELIAACAKCSSMRTVRLRR
jgi:hypothetical protein